MFTSPLAGPCRRYVLLGWLWLLHQGTNILLFVHKDLQQTDGTPNWPIEGPARVFRG